ncbi:MAG: ABC transporter permease [Ferroplasma sp.]|uniref:ABC transporter permease n=1 Tax=Ferroplasma sp. TaxID=2591003 RepID=UPI002815B600|nr:ABC transporter permease [Ferroplasma sp.]WMT51528.1 MAG: ABC transporter permease [Ferroplasma sp.]
MGGLIPLTVRDLKRWYRNPVSAVVGVIQPIFWIVLFGSAFDIAKFGGAASSAFFEGAPDYITYLMGGILTIIGLFTGMFSGVNIIWDRRLGILQRFLIAPINRASIVFSRILSSVVRILVQIVILFIVAFLIPDGLKLQHGIDALDIVVIVSAVLMISFIFSSLFSIIAVRTTKMESVFGIVNLINLPLMFASFAMFPPDLMAGWLEHVARYNPVSWSAQSIRMVIINGTLNSGQAHTVLVYMMGLLALTVFMLVITYVVSNKEIRE